jgi:hypothetical protein
MTSIELHVPAEVVTELDIPYEGTRGIHDFSVAIEGINFTASVVTLAALRPRVTTFASALRRWVLRQPNSTTTRLTIKGKGVDFKLDLPPNVSTAQIINALEEMIEYDDARDN